ncbi:MAG: hypothetical protein AAFO76_12890 [Cyanobacteria bacterium J06607_15]
MTFEEYNQILDRMLLVQQDIQVKQLENPDAIARITKKHEEISQKQSEIAQQQEKNTQAIANLTENISNLNIVSQRHEDRLTRLYGYQMTSDGDRLNIMQGVNDIKRRLTIIEERLNAG